MLIDLQLVFEKGLNTYKHDAFLYQLIYRYKKKYNQKIEDSVNIEKLKEQLKDPFKHFFDLTNINLEYISFKEDSPEFDHIIKEVCRDNIVTQNEKAYLTEKASEYFIDPKKLERYLDNPFFGHETFKIFVDQICEDLIVTDVERNYISEKALQYNVSFEEMNKMIDIGLSRASFYKKLTNSSEFYDIILIYLISNSLKIKNTESMLFEAIKSQSLKENYEIELLRNYAIEEIRVELSEAPFNLGEWKDLTELMQKLNITMLDFEKALSIFRTKEKKIATLSETKKRSSIDTIYEKIYIDSLKIENVAITKSDKLTRPFDVKFLGSKICIEYSAEIDEIILVKALSVFYLKNSKSISKTNLLKQINRILEQLLNDQN